jgi:hypothetical protein
VQKKGGKMIGCADPQRDMDLYKLLVEEVREIRRARRQTTNLFVTLNMGGVSALGFLEGYHVELSVRLAGWLIFALIMICLVWRQSNTYFTRLLEVKFGIIYELEAELKINAIKREWDILSEKSPALFFRLELVMPFLFITGYLIFFIHQFTIEDVREAYERAVGMLQELQALNH